MKNLLTTLFCFGLVSFVISQTCTPVYSPGYNDTSICAQIYEVENSNWLPDAYIHNAVCACQSIPTTSYQGNCIRQYLATQLTNTTKYSDSFKQEMAEQKENYLAHPYEDLVAYKEFIIDTFVPMIYADHQNAYKECCCVGTPAFYDSWEAVCTVDVPTCPMVYESIITFGSCDATPGSW